LTGEDIRSSIQDCSMTGQGNFVFWWISSSFVVSFRHCLLSVLLNEIKVVTCSHATIGVIPVNVLCPVMAFRFKLNCIREMRSVFCCNVCVGGRGEGRERDFPVKTYFVIWHDIGMRIEKAAYRYGGYLRIYSIISRGQPTRGGTPAWKLDDELKTPHLKETQLVAKCYTGPRNWRALGNTVMKFRVPWKAGNFLTSWMTISFRGGLRSME
jgi:hypothetical protein